MRIAWLTPYLPMPENTGGRIRIAQLAAGFDDHDELLLYSRISQHDVAGQAAVIQRGVWSQVRAELGNPRSSSLSSKPSPARAMPKTLAAMLAADDAREPFDAVVVEHCFAIEALPELRRAVVIVDEHNIESEYYRSQPLKNPFKIPQYLTWRRYERSVWRKADQVVTVSAQDARVVQQAEPKKGVVVANGTCIDAYRYLPPSRRAGSAVLYIGMMSYPPNVAAAVTLARDVMPALREHVPDATLTIAGRDAHPEVRALASEHVAVTGTLPNVYQLFDRHAAYAMPLSGGAGSSLKVLEPFAAGLPLVASAFGVRGHGLDGSEYIRAEGIAGFVAGLTRALTRRSELDAMSENARRVAERHAWSSLGRQFAGVVRQVIETRCPRSAVLT